VTRDEIFQVIRGHLADELEVDPDTISEATRFREDLEADSLDLYTLVQELEDSYGVRMSDEQAARIRTVGEAVEFVLSGSGGEAHAPAPTAAGRDAEAHAPAPASAGRDAE
jgi:acyl carrier protein